MGFAVFGGQRDYRHGRSARALPRLLAGLSLTALGLGLGVSGACSLIVDFTECRDNNDCASIDGSGPVRACTSENICVEAAEIECTGNTQCGDLFGSSFVCGADEEGAARCVNTTTAECEPIIWPEDWDHDKVVILGTVMPVGELFAALVQPLENAVQLAIQDFNKTTELPGGRKIAWVACNSNGVPDLAVAASDHLANRLHAPAIIGPIFSENVIKVATEVTIPAGTFTITPAASSPSITTLDDDDLVWRPISSDVYQASAIADWVTKVQDPAPDSVVFLAKDDAYGQGLLIDAGGRIEQNVGSFTSITYSNPATLTTEELTAEYGAVIGQTFALAPDTVIIAGTSEAQEFILGYLLVWGDLPEAERPALPVFLVPHAGVPILESTLESVPDPLLQQLLYTKLAGVAPIIHDVENYMERNTLKGDPATAPALAAVDLATINIDPWIPGKGFLLEDVVYRNPIAGIRTEIDAIHGAGARVDAVLWNVGSARLLGALLDEGLLDEPAFCEIALSDGLLATHPATARGMHALLEFMPEGRRAPWAYLVGGASALPLLPAAIEAGGHVALGLGDHAYRELDGACGGAPPRNADVVTAAVRAIRAAGCEPATPDEARELLGLAR